MAREVRSSYSHIIIQGCCYYTNQTDVEGSRINAWQDNQGRWVIAFQGHRYFHKDLGLGKKTFDIDRLSRAKDAEAQRQEELEFWLSGFGSENEQVLSEHRKSHLITNMDYFLPRKDRHEDPEL